MSEIPEMKEELHNDGKNYCGFCYCGGVEFEVANSATPHISVYCHCESCRRAHSAPLYQVVYIPLECLNITKGQELVKVFVKPGGTVKRSFCSDCGSKVTIQYSAENIGFFPALLEESIQHNLPEKFAPTHHY